MIRELSKPYWFKIEDKNKEIDYLKADMNLNSNSITIKTTTVNKYKWWLRTKSGANANY